MRINLRLLVLICCLLFTNKLLAEQVYQSTTNFVRHAFAGELPQAKTLWLNKAQKTTIADILQHKYHRLRIRYWLQGDASVWVLDEIGKESPITVGLHVKAQRLQQVKVLVYRESRGDEVKADFFTDQFIDAQLSKDLQLDTHIDGITGATLSVRALTKLARMALWLDQQVAVTSEQ